VRPSGRVLPLAGLLFAAAATAGLGTAQTSTPRRTVWDGVYTEAQATRGMATFGQSCAGCHALAADGKAPLVGDSFWKSFSQKTVGDLLEFVSTYMPNGTPGSLNAAAYQDIVALMLKSNGFPAGAAELRPGQCAGPRGRVPCSQWCGMGRHKRDNAGAGGACCPGRGRRNAASRQPHHAAQVRRDKAGCAGRFTRCSERAPDGRRRRGRHQRDDGDPRRLKVPLAGCTQGQSTHTSSQTTAAEAAKANTHPARRTPICRLPHACPSPGCHIAGAASQSSHRPAPANRDMTQQCSCAGAGSSAPGRR
jgi:S-disulfanyl-L-cysteine oxidoreductase SoxD